MTAPTDLSRLHAQALVSLVNAALADLQVEGRYTVYVGEVTEPEATIAYPYLVIWPAPAVRDVNLLNGYDGSATTTTQITAAGTTTEEVLAALDRASAALHRKTPTIPGRTWAPIRQVPGATPPQPDRDDTVNTATGRPVFTSFALFTLHSTPAGATP